jgi:type IV pilus assembly protein PilV
VKKAHRFETGFSIVEVLVALVVLAVGMLGMAGLYVTTLRSSGTAISRMQAVSLAADLADRIRANRLAGIAYEGNGAQKACVNTFDCSQEDMAANDLFVWQKQIDDLLPGDEANGTVDYTPGAADTPDSYTITVKWQEAEGGGNVTGDLQYVLTLQVAR